MDIQKEFIKSVETLDFKCKFCNAYINKEEFCTEYMEQRSPNSGCCDFYAKDELKDLS